MVGGTETWMDTVSWTADSVGSDKVMVLTGYRHLHRYEYRCQCGSRWGKETIRKLMWWHRWLLDRVTVFLGEKDDRMVRRWWEQTLNVTSPRALVQEDALLWLDHLGRCSAICLGRRNLEIELQGKFLLPFVRSQCPQPKNFASWFPNTWPVNCVEERAPQNTSGPPHLPQWGVHCVPSAT